MNETTASDDDDFERFPSSRRVHHLLEDAQGPVALRPGLCQPAGVSPHGTVCTGIAVAPGPRVRHGSGRVCDWRSSGVRVTLLDSSQAMLDIAKRTAQDQGSPERITLKQGRRCS